MDVQQLETADKPVDKEDKSWQICESRTDSDQPAD